MRCLLSGCSLIFKAYAKDSCRKALCCCMTMPVRILLPTHLETLQKLKYQVLAHPPYSPDLVPSDYHLFGPLKEALRGRRFASDQELKEAVMHGSLLNQKYFFSEGIKKLVRWWEKCIEKQGDCVEKWCYCKFSVFIEISFVSVLRIIIDSPTYIHTYIYIYIYIYTRVVPKVMSNNFL